MSTEETPPPQTPPPEDTTSSATAQGDVQEIRAGGPPSQPKTSEPSGAGGLSTSLGPQLRQVTFWVALAAALFTCLGVWITWVNRADTRRSEIDTRRSAIIDKLLDAEKHMGIQGSICADSARPPSSFEVATARQIAVEARNELSGTIENSDAPLANRAIFIQAEAGLLESLPEAQGFLDDLEKRGVSSARLFLDKATLADASGHTPKGLNALLNLGPPLDSKFAKDTDLKCALMERIVLRKKMAKKNPTGSSDLSEWSADKIRSDFDFLLSMFPKYQLGHAEYAQWLDSQHQPDDARAALYHLQRADQSDPRTWAWQAEAERQLGWEAKGKGDSLSSRSWFERAKSSYEIAFKEIASQQVSWGPEFSGGNYAMYGEVLLQVGDFAGALGAAGRAATALEGCQERQAAALPCEKGWHKNAVNARKISVIALACRGDWEKLGKYLTDAAVYAPDDKEVAGFLDYYKKCREEKRARSELMTSFCPAETR